MESLKFVMTTTFYPPYHIGGDSMHVYHLSNELAKIGHEVHVIHSIDSYHWQRKGEPTNEYPNHENVIVHSLKSPLGKVSPLISYIFGSPYPMTKEIKKIINHVKPDVLHHHNIAGFGPSVLKIRSKRVIYTAHDLGIICHRDSIYKYNNKLCDLKSNCFFCNILSKRPPQFWRYTGILEESVANIDLIITPSNKFKNYLKDFGINNRIETLYNFVPEPVQSFLNETSASYGPYVLYVGRLEPYKGILELLDIFKNKNNFDCGLLIFGTGSLKNIVSKLSTESGGKILYLGNVPPIQLTPIYRNALALIIPSQGPENCPLVALEALSFGLPLIVTNVGGLPEIINTSKAGIIIDKNLQELAGAIEKIKTDSRFANSTRQAFKENYSPYAYIYNYINLMESIIPHELYT